MTPQQWAQFGLGGLVAGGCLLLVWHIAKLVLTRPAEAGAGGEGSPAVAGMTPLACQIDPLHFQHIAEVADTVRVWDDKIHAGDFSCVWRDRDEVRDFLEASKDGVRIQAENLEATRELTTEVRALAAEIRTTRNGGHN